MGAGPYDLFIEQGSDWSRELAVSDEEEEGVADLTGYTAKLQIRSAPGVDPVLYELNTTDPPGGITIEGPEGLITLHIPPDVSAEWEWTRGEYDLKLDPPNDGEPFRLLKGNVFVSLAVTT